jgi:hypothetical protein
MDVGGRDVVWAGGAAGQTADAQRGSFHHWQAESFEERSDDNGGADGHEGGHGRVGGSEGFGASEQTQVQWPLAGGSGLVQ